MLPLLNGMRAQVFRISRLCSWKTACEIRLNGLQEMDESTEWPHHDNLLQRCGGYIASIFKSWQDRPWKRSVSAEPSTMARLSKRFCLLTCLKTSSTLWFSLKTNQMKVLLALRGSPYLRPHLEQYVSAVSFQIIMYINEQFNEEGRQEIRFTAA